MLRLSDIKAETFVETLGCLPKAYRKRHARKATAAVNAAEALSKPSSLAACSGFRVEG